MPGISRLRMAARQFQRYRDAIHSIRAYGSAAHLEYDYDDEEENDLELQNGRRGVMLDSDGSVSSRGVQWVLMGDPGAKKHVYAKRLSELLQVPHISMGSLVRQELNPRSSLYKQIADAVNQGKLVPEDIIFGLLSKRLEEGHYRGETGFILDGIPRTRIQAEILDQIADIDLVVNFKCTDLLVKHMGNGPASSSFQELLSVKNSQSNLDFQKLENQLQSSSAGAEVSLKERLISYAEQNKTLEEYYREQRKLLDFQVTGAPGETWKGLLAALHLQHMNAYSSSQKLTA